MAIEVVTIVNSSGKIISNGKNVWSVFKEAKAVYDDKKAQMKADKADKVPRSINNTYEIVPPASEYEEEQPLYTYGTGSVRRASHPMDEDARSDARSYASSQRSHRTKHSKASKSSRRTALTANNLKTLSEVSSEAPSRAPVEYRQPYAETAPYETQLTRRPSLAHTRTLAAPSVSRAPSHYPVQYADEYEDQSYYEEPRYYMPVHRSRSDPSLNEARKSVKEIDMNLAYGNVPPDLADRIDLDPAYRAAEKERKARSLMEKIEGILNEANCLHHSATHMIKHLQENPQLAASVALSLGELSALVGKMSPAFLGVIKGGSPAIFALLASPQFLVATGAAAGLTAVMFGGWKIVKKIQNQEAARALPMTYEAQSLPAASQADPDSRSRAPSVREEGSYDEAMVIDDDLSSIDTWRRGIAPMGEDESVDLELISPEAYRASRSQFGDMDDTRSVRTSKTSKTAKSHKSSKTTSSRHTSKSHAKDDSAVPDKKSKDDDAASEAGSVRSHRSHHSSKSTKSTKSNKTSATHKTSATRKTIEAPPSDKENTLESILRPKKDTMLKSLFKKKEKELDLVETASSKNKSASTLKLG